MVFVIWYKKGEKMKKLAIGIGILILLAVVMPAVAAPVRLPMTTGAGYFICPNSNGEKCKISWDARMDKLGNVKGNAQLMGGYPESTYRARIDKIEIYDNVAYVSGIITFSSIPEWVDGPVCFKVKDGGKGGDDYVSSWYMAEIDFCKYEQSPPYFYLLEGGRATVI
jgi:hypothetical protein